MIKKIKSWLENEKIQFKFVNLEKVVRLNDGMFFEIKNNIMYRSMIYRIETFDKQLVYVMLCRNEYKDDDGRITKVFCYAQINDLDLI